MRVLLLFAPVRDDPQLLAQNLAIAAASHGARERDLVVVTAIGPSGLRQRFGVLGDGFVLVLLGKDGEEKWRRDTPATAAQVFAVIDRMPMRRSEMGR